MKDQLSKILKDTPLIDEVYLHSDKDRVFLKDTQLEQSVIIINPVRYKPNTVTIRSGHKFITVKKKKPLHEKGNESLNSL